MARDPQAEIIKTLKRRGRGLEGLKSGLPMGDEFSLKRAEEACDEAAAILYDAAAVIEEGPVPSEAR